MINMTKSVSRNTAANTTTIDNFTIPICNKNPPNISVEKKKDLLSLLKYIPTIYHTYYKNLPTENQVEDPLLDSEEEED